MAAAGAALSLQHLGSTLRWLEPASAAVQAGSCGPLVESRAVAFWGWSSEMWGFLFVFFFSLVNLCLTTKVVSFGEVVIHRGEMQ